MKRFERFLALMIMAGILALSGCASGDPASPRRNTGYGISFKPLAGPTSASASASTSALTFGSSFQGEKIPADKVVVYIYRPVGSGAGGQAIPFGVKASGKVEITLVQGGYYVYISEPGQIEFSAFEIGLMAPTSVSSITVDAKAGQAYYLKGAHGKGLGGRAHLESVSPEVGVNEIVNCKVITTQ